MRPIVYYILQANSSCAPPYFSLHLYFLKYQNYPQNMFFNYMKFLRLIGLKNLKTNICDFFIFWIVELIIQILKLLGLKNLKLNIVIFFNYNPK